MPTTANVGWPLNLLADLSLVFLKNQGRETVFVKKMSTAFVADNEVLEALEKHSCPISLPDNRILFRQGDPAVGLYILKSGRATLTMRSAGGKIVMRVEAATGSLLGLPGMLGNVPYTLTAEAMDGSELSFLSHAEFYEMIRSDPQLALKLLQVLAAEVRSARQVLSSR